MAGVGLRQKGYNNSSLAPYCTSERLRKNMFCVFYETIKVQQSERIQVDHEAELPGLLVPLSSF
jgi:hypothetical protein